MKRMSINNMYVKEKIVIYSTCKNRRVIFEWLRHLHLTAESTTLYIRHFFYKFTISPRYPIICSQFKFLIVGVASYNELFIMYNIQWKIRRALGMLIVMIIWYFSVESGGISFTQYSVVKYISKICIYCVNKMETYCVSLNSV